MAQIIFEINEDKLQRVERAMAGLFPVPKKQIVPDPK
jgi:hypothetical protein